MNRNLDDLSGPMRTLADLLLFNLATVGVTVRVISTLRTMAEHQANLRKGTSSALLSFHLPRYMRVPTLSPDHPDHGKSDAMDLVLITDRKAIWDISDPRWKEIGHQAEEVGLEWGGRWRKPYDPGHVQLPRARWAK